MRPILAARPYAVNGKPFDKPSIRIVANFLNTKSDANGEE
jgi:hypothetical protein